jgi:hypothetical protein
VILTSNTIPAFSNSFGSMLLECWLLDLVFNGLQNEANHRAAFCSAFLERDPFVAGLGRAGGEGRGVLSKGAIAIAHLCAYLKK